MIRLKKNLNLFVLLFTAIIFIKCVDLPDEVMLPEWDIELNVPLMNRSYTLKEIIKTQEHISVDTANNLFLLQSGKYSLNNTLSEFVNINETSSLENVPAITSLNDSFIVYVQFPQGLEVDSGEFASGVINFTVNNPSPENVSVIIKAPAFYNDHGEIIIIQNDVDAGQINSISFNLDGYNYQKPSDQPLSLRNSFRLIVRAISDQPGNIIFTDLSMSGLAFSHVTGLLPSKSLGENVSVYDFDVDEVEQYRDRSFLSEAKLNLRADYYSVFNAPNILEIKELNIIGRRNDGTEFYLKDKQNNPSFTIRMTNGTINRIFNEDNSNINEFISFFPDSVILQAEYVVNPDNNTGTFSNLDSIKFQIDFSTKSFLALRTTTIEDETEIQISETDRKDIKNGKKADIKFEIENGIPLKAWFRIDALGKDGEYLFTLTNDIAGGDSISFNAASINSAGEVIQTNVNPVKTISLNEEQVNLFSETYSLRYRVSFHTADANLNPPPVVAIRPSDWIKLKTYGSVKYRVSND